MSDPSLSECTRYFVDEAGDGTLFDSSGRVIVGQDGCSTHFILGILHVGDVAALSKSLAELRTDLVRSPFFKGVPSMDPRRGRTTVLFHAKDDPAEVRWEVFKVLAKHPTKFFAVVRDKAGLAIDVRNKNRQSAEYRYHPNRLYDEMVRRLFRDRLHKDERYEVCFASRGASDRTAALSAALGEARDSFRRKWGVEGHAPVEVVCCASKDSAGLQAADYFLWALQRVYTRGEDRFIEFLADSFSLVHDVDDRRMSGAGVYYTKRNPLSAEKIKRSPGI